ncbi:rhodanese-like domain-containing protein [Halobacteria archaeon AArc-m2/3/4]|uniref:Rhodanese-like domain-containing protein n=1 Tax=Natronoglomus mannanivorans TaxID=2979990 RepID=A0AAP2Z121_9EURY|nr:rhodanese-like domain-containing protein [Halobacteria archaeon AArc-xg1-1]MCU4972229.1 rhodanese-like domain-containing protein [Halobacteria archaeon AArc-m2/3/4]
MRRRTFLAAGGAVTLGAIAGCLADEAEFVSVDEAVEWHENDEANFVDARSQRQFDDLHITGAVFSPAADGLETNDPVEEWSTDTRIVTYCDCPHALAEQRAESLAGRGYGDVYILDEGFIEWGNRGYPVEGASDTQSLPSYEVRGVSDPAYAGEDVWIRDLEYGQRELGPVGDDGSYELTLHFSDLTDDTVLEVEAPDYTLEATLAELTSSVVGEELVA